MDESQSDVRWTAIPSKFDIQPYGTIVKVVLNDEGTEYELFVQVSEDEANSIWMSGLELLAMRHAADLLDPEFVKNLL